MAGIEMLAPRSRSASRSWIFSSTMPAQHGARISTNFPESGWDKVMNLNLKTPFFLTKALAAPLRAAATRGEARQSHQHRLDRRHLRQSAGDLFLRRQQVRPDPPDPPDGGKTDPRPHRGVGDRAGTVQVRHEQGGARQCRRGGDAGAVGPDRHRRGHGGRCDLSRLARRRLRGRRHHRGRRRHRLCQSRESRATAGISVSPVRIVSARHSGARVFASTSDVPLPIRGILGYRAPRAPEWRLFL